MSGETIIIGGISAVVLIPLLIQVAKIFGLPSKLAPPLAILLGVTLGVLAEVVKNNDWLLPWVVAVIGGMMAGLAAIGAHSATTYYQTKIDERNMQQAAEEQQATITATATATPDVEGVRTEVDVDPMHNTHKGGAHNG